MKQIERYIFRRVLILSVGTLATTTVIALTTQVLLRVNLLSSTGQSLLTFLELAGLLVPSMMLIVMPFALMIGAAQTLSTMNTDSELAVIEASGGSRQLIARPILLIATTMSVFCLVEANLVEPWSNRQVRQLLDKASADLFSAAVQSGTFHGIDENLYVSVAEKYPGGRLGGIFLSDNRDEEIDLLYFSKYGEFAEINGQDVLIMSDGELHRKETSDGDLSIIRFATYALDLSLIGGGSGRSGGYSVKEQSTAFLLNPDPEDARYKREPQEYTMRLNKRLTEWMYPLLFGFITVYFLGRAHSHRDEQIWSVVTAAAIAFAMRGFSFYTIDKSSTSFIFGLLCYIVPIGGTIFFAILIATNWTFRVPKFLIELSDRIASGNESLLSISRHWIAELTGTGRKGAQ
ncbi:MAG: LptF/LptG family permease [Hyphomicrobiales bacterium]|nr:LptF/LptG family permease [Hyphomicrobiales bacterium]MCP4997481.1 LptF/LptG family permease [Hyphomicrobiales bacterium]